MYLLDVAVGPIIIIFGLALLLIVAVVVALVVFSVKAIKKIKAEAEIRDGDHKKR